MGLDDAPVRHARCRVRAERQVTTREAELPIVEIFGLTAQLNQLSSLHTADGTRLPIPAGFGAEILASDLGLRHDYPTNYDYLETSAGRRCRWPTWPAWSTGR